MQANPYAQFERAKIAAEVALKDWFVDQMKENLLKVKQKKFDEKFPRPTPEDAW